MEPNPLLPSIPVLIAIVVGVVILVAVIIVIVVGARRAKRRGSVPPSRESHNPGSGHHDEG
ncbi:MULTISPECIES: hypothetical protein [unclassified Microbacterium]|uniref:hypothetical protein n=1 Tax=unclassified Microbacterium TaxID=2609290 RepID=UPI0008F4D82B|nr:MULTISPECIES: hypothetical protein [unclassified Microbacterium]OIJ31956.1 hypothetical protein BK819_14125 [Microbacterium sp. LCT-H2]